MTLYSPYGDQIEQGIDLAAAAEAANREIAAEVEHPAADKDLEPGPGQVILLRDKQPKLIKENGVIKPNPLAKLNNFARVARVGPNRSDWNAAWFAQDDVVLVNDSLLETVELADGESIEIAPFTAIRGKFVSR